MKKWEFEAGGAIVSTPIVYDGTLYFGSLDRKIYAVNADTGKLLAGFKPFEAGNWFWSKAVAYNGSIIDCSLDGGVYAIDAVTGAELWSAKVNGSIRGNPALVNNVLVVGTDGGNNRGKAYGLDLDNRGREVWEYPKADESMYSIHASVGVSGDIVYVHTTEQKIYAINATLGTYLWSNPTGGGQ
jgi:outer membrane protein assembly factor BamB